MGGGSMLRAAAKLSGIGVLNTGLRGSVVPETPISAAQRSVSCPIGAIAVKSSSDGVKTNVANDTPGVKEPRSADIDDWEFPGGDDDMFAGTDDHLPRLVFGGPPTIEEAKEATNELKDALEKLSVSSPRSIGYESLHGSGNSTCSLQLSNTDVIENKTCLIGASSVPRHAIRAFRFLDQSPQLQEAIGSLVSDPNVWDAVLQNPALQRYLQSHAATYSSVHQNVGESLVHGDVHYQEPPLTSEIFSGTGKSEGDMLYPTSPRSSCVTSEAGKGSGALESNSKKEKFQKIWKNAKLAVANMLSSLSDFFNSLFEDDSKFTAFSSRLPPGLEKVLGPSIVGVVVMVIMVVVLKRV